jgi:hypothetical protein
MSGSTTNLLLPTPDTADAGKDVILSGALSRIDSALAGTAFIATTGGTTTVSDSQFASAAIEITGALTANATLVFPIRGCRMLIKNATTGAFTLELKSGSGGAPVALASGATKWLWIKNATGAIALV